MNFMPKFGLVAIVALVTMVGNIHPGYAQEDKKAEQYIQTVGDKALGALDNDALSTEQKMDILRRLFKQNLDFDWVGKFVMGRYWREATAEQKKDYLSAYQDFLTRHYTSRFSDYTSGDFKITGSRKMDKGEAVVNMSILSENKSEPPILIDYKVRKVGSRFKVFDIIVEGVSLLNTQRSEFTAVINQHGIDGLIERLRAK